jgi:hypothetical protein
MACLSIINGREIDCKDSVGGVLELYVTEADNINSITASSGIITAISMKSGKKFFTLKMERNNAQFEQGIVGSQENGTLFHEQTVTFNYKKMTAALRNHVLTLALNRCVFIVKDGNGLIQFLGKDNGLDVGDSTATTGRALGDMNGYNLTFTGQEKDPAYFLDQSVLTSVL